MDTKHEFDSPFLTEELFSRETTGEWDARASAIASESPFQEALTLRELAAMELTSELEKDEPEQDEADLYEFEGSSGWKRTNIQLVLKNYRNMPLEHYLVVGYVEDSASGKRALLGKSGPLEAASTGSTGVVTFPRALVPSDGTLVLNCYPHLTDLEPGWDRTKLFTKSWYVGDFLSGSFEDWKRTRETMKFSVVQESRPIQVRARHQDQVESILKREGRIGFGLGPVEAGGSGGTQSGTTAVDEREYLFHAREALASLKITEVTRVEEKEEFAGVDQGEEPVEAWSAGEEPEEPEWTSEDTAEEKVEGEEQQEKELEQAAVQVEGEVLGKIKTGIDIITSGDFSSTATIASCVRDGVPLPPFSDCTCHFSITALHPESLHNILVGREHSTFWFMLSFQYNGLDLKRVAIDALVSKSSTMRMSKFTISFTPPSPGDTCRETNNPIAEIPFKIAGRWDPVEIGEVTFFGELLVRANGYVLLRVDSEDQWVRHGVVTRTCKKLEPPVARVPAPSFEVVLFSPSGSWTLKRGDNQKLLAWWDKLPVAIRERITAGQLPISIHAYASTKGKTRSNLILSKKRAEAVKEILMGEAGSGAAFRIFPHGEMRAGTPDHIESEKERRAIVEVIF